MTSILEELFYGNVCPGTGFRKKDAKTRKLMTHLADHHEALSGTLTEKLKELLKSLMIAMVNSRIAMNMRSSFMLSALGLGSLLKCSCRQPTASNIC